ncbi:MAG TPA: transketolase, partial [Thalassobaculum sp.]
VSMPCRELFAAQDAGYREQVLGGKALRVVVEAGVRMPWEQEIGPGGGFVGMTGFGASAPAEALYRHFGITPEAVAQEARQRLAARGR